MISHRRNVKFFLFFYMINSLEKVNLGIINHKDSIKIIVNMIMYIC